MPPPNITGKLHMGHALFLSIQDSIHRFNKNLGITSLWIPGLDHAGLATHDKIIQYQKKQKISYETAAIEIEKIHREIIIHQIKEMGALPDWDYLTYTLDDSYQEFILKILKICLNTNRITFKDGQIYLNIQDLAKELADDLRNGLFNIYPNYEIKNLLPFLDNMEPWNISRQIPWGTKLPFKIDGDKILWSESGEISGSLDTWFNSSLYPLAALYKKDNNLLDQFYPAELIETGSDILFFWCAKMLMMSSLCYKHKDELGLSLSSKYAFQTIYLHGLIRDKNGEKFSKSLGNGIDPLDMIKKYGADATRLFLITRSGPSEDIIFNEDELIIYKKFMNKIWNSARFFSIYAEKYNIEQLEGPILLEESDKDQISLIQKDFCHMMSSYQLLQASRYIHSQFKEFFCDTWIERNKDQIQMGNIKIINQGIYLLDQMLSMIEPFCPYICNEIKKNFWKNKCD